MRGSQHVGGVQAQCLKGLSDSKLVRLQGGAGQLEVLGAGGGSCGVAGGVFLRPAELPRASSPETDNSVDSCF